VLALRVFARRTLSSTPSLSCSGRLALLASRRPKLCALPALKKIRP
jgi:hypothetical protein